MKFIIYLLMAFALFSCSSENTYYLDAVNGDDSNSGHSPGSAWATLDQVNKLQLQAGTKILLANGSRFEGCIELKNVSGSIENPILISNYDQEGNDALPIIDARGKASGMLVENSTYITLSNLAITGDGGGVSTAEDPRQNMHCGVLVTTTEPGEYGHIHLDGLKIYDVFFEEKGFQRGTKEVRTPNGMQSYGWGIRVINRTAGASIKNVLLENCEVENVAHTGIKFTGSEKNIEDVKLLHNRVSHTGGPGMQMSGVKDVLVSHNQVQFSGSPNDSRKWGRGSGFWCWGSEDVLIEHNSFRKANGPGDSAGLHIDFNCKNVVVQYNLSEGNAGGFCEILGNNYNCSYRYNISINDGHRVKGENGAFQEGKIFWLSGFNGSNKKRKGPFNSYFYNNTIYVSKGIVAKIAVDRASSGVLIANNIFCFQGESKEVKGDQYKPETKGESRVEKIVFKNNLYINPTNWPDKVLIQDSDPVYGNPDYKNPGGLKAEDYIPQNLALVKDKGIEVEKIPGDTIGLTIGLQVTRDFFGNPVQGLPDMGAIEIN